jgi:beta-glucanase (GH16 family)
VPRGALTSTEICPQLKTHDPSRQRCSRRFWRPNKCREARSALVQQMTGIDLSHFQLAFADEFNSFDWSPDGSHGWRTMLDWGNRTLGSNHEAQYYSDSSVGVNPFHLHDGVLDITATAGSNPQGLPYNSGVITTQNSFSQFYGYFEMRAELPAGAGLWPAFWLLPVNHSWPPELDVFEVLGSDPTTAVVTVHSASTGTHTMVASAVATADLSRGFHTFGVNWEPDIIQWYIDGVEVAEAPTPADMHQPMYLLASLAVGGPGSWPGVADPSAFPATMSIDYIHVYQPLEQQGAFAFSAATAGTTVYTAESGVAPDATELNVLIAFITTQYAYGQQIGVMDPVVYAYQAVGAALATTAAHFQITFGPSSPAYSNSAAGDARFAADAYASVFGHPGSSAQVQHFIDQLKFFEGIYTASGAFGSAENVDLLARGAIYGQMLGIHAELIQAPIIGVSAASDVTHDAFHG